jgi:hypothetical protein
LKGNRSWPSLGTIATFSWWNWEKIWRAPARVASFTSQNQSRCCDNLFPPGPDAAAENCWLHDKKARSCCWRHVLLMMYVADPRGLTLLILEHFDMLTVLTGFEWGIGWINLENSSDRTVRMNLCADNTCARAFKANDLRKSRVIWTEEFTQPGNKVNLKYPVPISERSSISEFYLYSFTLITGFNIHNTWPWMWRKPTHIFKINILNYFFILIHLFCLVSISGFRFFFFVPCIAIQLCNVM